MSPSFSEARKRPALLAIAKLIVALGSHMDVHKVSRRVSSHIAIEYASAYYICVRVNLCVEMEKDAAPPLHQEN